MVGRLTSKPRRGGYHSGSKVEVVSVDSNVGSPIKDDSNRIAPGDRETHARGFQFRTVTEDYFRTHVYGGRVHPPNYDNG